MKTKVIALGLVAAGTLLFGGCIAFPPLVQVEHKDSVSNAELMKRLDAIDSRLNHLEQKGEPKPTQ